MYSRLRFLLLFKETKQQHLRLPSIPCRRDPASEREPTGTCRNPESPCPAARFSDDDAPRWDGNIWSAELGRHTGPSRLPGTSKGSRLLAPPRPHGSIPKARTPSEPHVLSQALTLLNTLLALHAFSCGEAQGRQTGSPPKAMVLLRWGTDPWTGARKLLLFHGPVNKAAPKAGQWPGPHFLDKKTETQNLNGHKKGLQETLLHRCYRAQAKSPKPPLPALPLLSGVIFGVFRYRFPCPGYKTLRLLYVNHVSSR